MVDAQVRRGRDRASSHDSEIRLESASKRVVNLLGLARSRDALIKIAQHHRGHRGVPLPKNGSQAAQIAEVIFPRAPVFAARTDLGVSPRDADPEDWDEDKNAERQRRRRRSVKLKPRWREIAQHYPGLKAFGPTPLVPSKSTGVEKRFLVRNSAPIFFDPILPRELHGSIGGVPI